MSFAIKIVPCSTELYCDLSNEDAYLADNFVQSICKRFEHFLRGKHFNDGLNVIFGKSLQEFILEL